MYKIIGSRGSGKTSSLFQKIECLQNKTDRPIMVFVKEPHLIQDLAKKYGYNFKANVSFAKFDSFFTLKGQYNIIDEIDDFLTFYDVCAYSMSTYSKDYSILDGGENNES